jgi:hypothetical protein
VRVPFRVEQANRDGLPSKSQAMQALPRDGLGAYAVAFKVFKDWLEMESVIGACTYLAPYSLVKELEWHG